LKQEAGGFNTTWHLHKSLPNAAGNVVKDSPPSDVTVLLRQFNKYKLVYKDRFLLDNFPVSSHITFQTNVLVSSDGSDILCRPNQCWHLLPLFTFAALSLIAN
jgi:hypothetical protein